MPSSLGWGEYLAYGGLRWEGRQSLVLPREIGGDQERRKKKSRIQGMVFWAGGGARVVFRKNKSAWLYVLLGEETPKSGALGAS